MLDIYRYFRKIEEEIKIIPTCNPKKIMAQHVHIFYILSDFSLMHTNILFQNQNNPVC